MLVREIRALFDKDSITVYQAFNPEIAHSAVANQRFTHPTFKIERMTWIKPSFLWMMYRSGWGEKKNQECILAIKIKRSGFEWALENSCLSHYDSSVYSSYEDWKHQLVNSPIRIQWDPEKDIHSQPLSYRSIQIGLSGVAVEKYIADWICGIDDITDKCKEIHQHIIGGEIMKAKGMLPCEQTYPLPISIALKINSY